MSNVHTLDPYARAKRMHPSSQPAPVAPVAPITVSGDDEHDGRGALVLAFPVHRAVAARAAADGHPAVAR